MLTCATGDSFINSDDSHSGDVVDMEAYALAKFVLNTKYLLFHLNIFQMVQILLPVWTGKKTLVMGNLFKSMV